MIKEVEKSSSTLMDEFYDTEASTLNLTSPQKLKRQPFPIKGFALVTIFSFLDIQSLFYKYSKVCKRTRNIMLTNPMKSIFLSQPRRMHLKLLNEIPPRYLFDFFSWDRKFMELRVSEKSHPSFQFSWLPQCEDNFSVVLESVTSQASLNLLNAIE